MTRVTGSLIALARPRGTLLLLIVPLTGYGFAHWDFEMEAQRPLSLALVLVAWIFLSAGSLWLNANLDGDEGQILFSRGGVGERPAHLDLFSYAALATATCLAFVADVIAGLACATCSVLAILYSHPKTMWKARPWLGPLVNVSGYGVLSWIAGWSVARLPMTARNVAAMILFATFVFGMAFAAQAYQREDDARRGYRTLVVTRGPAACLRVAIACTRVTIAGVAVLSALGVYPRLVLFGLPLYALPEITMARWRRAPNGGSPAFAASFAARMLAVGVAFVALATFSVLR